MADHRTTRPNPARRQDGAADYPNASIETEDDTPVDNLFSEEYACWPTSW